MATYPGRGGGAPKQWKKDRRYCCHGTCNSNTTDFDPEVRMLPFPKPCSIYVTTIYDNSVTHDVKMCTQCSKARRWIHLCKRADKGLQELSDINKMTYICTKHFADSNGPTEMHPDPFPADKDVLTVNKCKSKLRKQRVTRPTHTKPKKRKECEGGSDTLPLPDELEFVDCNKTTFEKAYDEEQLEASDSRIASQPTTSCPVPEEFLTNLAINLVLMGWFICFNTKLIRIKVGKVHILICCNYQINFEVKGKTVPGNIYLWKAFPRSFDPKQGNCVEILIEILETVKQQWKVCKCHFAAETTRELDQLEMNPPIDHGQHSLSSSRCQILVMKEVCDSCKIMQKYRARKLSNVTLVSQNTNLRYMSRSEALDCVKSDRKKLRLEKRKAARLRSKLARFIESRGTELTENDSASFLDILSSSMEASTATSSVCKEASSNSLDADADADGNVESDSEEVSPDAGDAKKMPCQISTILLKFVQLFFPNYAFAKLFLSNCIPALNALIPLFYAGQIPDSSSLAIASQFVFVSIILEVVQEAIVNSLFNLVGRDYQCDRTKALQALKMCLLILLLLGMLLCILVIAFTGGLVDVINTPDAIAEATKKYLYISAFSFPIILMNEAIKCHLLLTTHILMVVSSLCQTVFIFILNFYLFGTQSIGAHWGVEQLGVYKVIESITYFCTSAFFFFIIEKMSPITFLFRISLFSDLKRLLISIFNVSWGNFGDSLVRNFFYFAVTLSFVNYISPDEAAAWNLLNSIVWTFFLIPSYALTNQVKIVVGLHAGSSNLKAKLRKVAVETARGLCVWTLVVGIVSATCWSWMAKLFSPNNTAVQEISRRMFSSVGWAFIAFSISSAISGIFSGTGKTRFIFYQSLISNLVVYFGPWIAYLTGSLEPTSWLVTTLYSSGNVLNLLLSVAFAVHVWRRI